MKDSGTTAGVGFFTRIRNIVSKINEIINLIGMFFFRLRKIVLTVPVAGINLQSSGEFAQFVTRDVAVMGPLGLTAACLMLMFCSRKALYPWAISVFTLIVPLLILFTNLYPA